MVYPLVMTNIAIEHGHRHSEFSHQTWWFSKIVLDDQRVTIKNDMVGAFPQLCWTRRDGLAWWKLPSMLEVAPNHPFSKDYPYQPFILEYLHIRTQPNGYNHNRTVFDSSNFLHLKLIQIRTDPILIDWSPGTWVHPMIATWMGPMEWDNYKHFPYF